MNLRLFSASRWSAIGVASLLLLLAASRAGAQSEPTPAQLPPSSAVMTSGPQLSHEQLEDLLGPIALYPDALIALILPAATAPSDIVLAARYLTANGNSAQVDNQPWDESVRGLAHYPDVIKWMDENLAWTKQVGEAFVTQPANVMQAVQRLRLAARAASTLVDTPQQKVVTEGEIIIIEPAQPDVIYVPRYDPDIVYVTRSPGWTQPSLFFGVGFAAGAWLTYDLDWPGCTIWVGDWRRQPQRVWVRPTFPNRPLRPGVPPPVARPWRPPEHRYIVPPRSYAPRPSGVIVNPRPMPGTPPRPPGFNPPPRRNFNPPRANTPVTPPGAINPPVIGAPTSANPPFDRDRRGERSNPPGTPPRPRAERPETRPTPPTVNPLPASPSVPTVNPPPVVTPPPTNIGNPGGIDRRPTRPERTERSPERERSADRPNRPDRADRPERPERSSDSRRESRPTAPAPTPPPPVAPPPSNRPPNDPPAENLPR